MIDRSGSGRRSPMTGCDMVLILDGNSKPCCARMKGIGIFEEKEIRSVTAYDLIKC